MPEDRGGDRSGDLTIVAYRGGVPDHVRLDAHQVDPDEPVSDLIVVVHRRLETLYNNPKMILSSLRAAMA